MISQNNPYPGSNPLDQPGARMHDSEIISPALATLSDVQDYLNDPEVGRRAVIGAIQDTSSEKIGLSGEERRLLGKGVVGLRQETLPRAIARSQTFGLESRTMGSVAKRRAENRDKSHQKPESDSSEGQDS